MGTPRTKTHWWLPLLVAVAATAPARADAPSPVGRWLVQDRRAVIEVFACGPKFCGRIVWQEQPLDPDGTVSLDRHNPDPALRSHPLCDLQMMAGFTATAGSPGEWQDGSIYDPESGNSYSASLRLKDANTLLLRGYIVISLLGETQTWTRDTGHPDCSKE